MARIYPLMLVPPILFAALAGLFIWGMDREDPTQLPTALAGQEAPGVMVTPLQGPVLTDAMLRDGKVKIVNFFASWCAPCRIEHPNLTKLTAEGITVYGVNYKDEPAKALAFLAELGNPYAAIGADATGRMALDWGVYGVPESFVIDGQGRVVFRFAGPLTERSIDNDLRPALAKAAGH